MITRTNIFRRWPRHRGMTSMLAMLYLVLISTLAIGGHTITAEYPEQYYAGSTSNPVDVLVFE